MSLTSDQIIDRAANDLGILELGQSLPAEDDARLTQGYSEVYQYLKTKGLAIWASTAEVPDDIAPYVVMMLTHNCLSTYPVSNDRFLRIVRNFSGEVGKSSGAEDNIRRLVNSFNSLQEDPVDF